MLQFNIQDEMISYNKETKTFVTEASDIRLPAQYWNSEAWSPVETEIELLNILSNQTKLFTFQRTEKKSFDWEPEVGTWVYTSDNYTLLIFND